MKASSIPKNTWEKQGTPSAHCACIKLAFAVLPAKFEKEGFKKSSHHSESFLNICQALNTY